jgi:hypothetical protein
MRAIIKNLNKNLFNNNIKLLPIIFLILFSRLIPHPPNFTPIISIAILSPLFFNKNIISLSVLILGMFVTDIFLGIYSNMIFIYLAIVLIFYFSKSFFKLDSFKKIILCSFFSSLIFFIVTNFAVWSFNGLYSKNLEGLIACYLLAIPFFHNTLISTMLFSSITYFVFYKLKGKFIYN